MPYFPLKHRLKIALGGLVSVVGFMILVFALMTATRTVNSGSIVQDEFIVAVAVIVGVLDIICGFLLFRKK